MLIGVCFLSIFYKWSWKKPLAIVLILAGIVLSNKGLTAYYEQLIGGKIGVGTPKIAYITMGLRDDPNRQTLGAVSYTHLDVYKRQLSIISLKMILDLASTMLKRKSPLIMLSLIHIFIQLRIDGCRRCLEFTLG